jgi:hypothetical protein
MKKAFTDNLDLQWMSLFWVTAVEVPRASRATPMFSHSRMLGSEMIKTASSNHRDRGEA